MSPAVREVLVMRHYERLVVHGMEVDRRSLGQSIRMLCVDESSFEFVPLADFGQPRWHAPENPERVVVTRAVIIGLDGYREPAALAHQRACWQRVWGWLNRKGWR